MMSIDWITVGRPYAKAVFESAVDKEDLKGWSGALKHLAYTAELPEMQACIKNPVILPAQIANVFIEAVKLKKEYQYFVELLAESHRLGALPAIYRLYEELRAEYEKTITADVFSFEALTAEQKNTLTAVLKKRLKRDVHLTEHVDKSLLAGAVVRAGAIVIDGSARGKLHRLNEEMMR